MFDRRGRCVALSRLQNTEEFSLNQIDGELRAASDIAAELTSLTAGRDVLALCRSGAVESSTMAKRQAGSPQITASDLVDVLTGPDVLVAEDVEPTEPPTTPEPPTATEPPAITEPSTPMPPDVVVPEKRDPEDIMSISHLKTQVREADDLLHELVEELEEVKAES